MEKFQVIATIPYVDAEGWKGVGQLRLIRVLDKDILVFAPEVNELCEQFFIKFGSFMTPDGKEFNAKAVMSYEDDGTCFFNIPESIGAFVGNE